MADQRIAQTILRYQVGEVAKRKAIANAIEVEKSQKALAASAAKEQSQLRQAFANSAQYHGRLYNLLAGDFNFASKIPKDRRVRTW